MFREKESLETGKWELLNYKIVRRMNQTVLVNFPANGNLDISVPDPGMPFP